MTALACLAATAGDDFSFEPEEFAKSPLTTGGYLEASWEHLDLNQDSALSRLRQDQDLPASRDRLAGAVQLDGSYLKGIAGLHWLLKAAGQLDDQGWLDHADIFASYLSLSPGPQLELSLGKQSYRWGKGYAWNPVGFLNRSKDPNNPEETLEGYLTAEAEWIRSSSALVENIALTGVVLPVWQGVNEEFGRRDQLKLAAKLYLLFRDTDIDLLWYSGSDGSSGSNRSSSFGLDFSRNITTNFELHGELAHSPGRERIILEADSTTATARESLTSWLLGLRYLNRWNLTTILEYYHNGSGYSTEELDRFYQLGAEAEQALSREQREQLLNQARKLSLQGYGRPNPGRDYLYARFSLREPGEILYFTPALTTIINLEDRSCSLTPELLYTGLSNWEIRLRFALLLGSSQSEFGEKLNSNRLELRLRAFF